MSTVAARQALLKPIVERARSLASIQEDQWFDRKSSRTSAQKLAEVLVGFANAEGGTVVLGIWNNKVEGVDRSAKLHNSWRQAAMDFTSPCVRLKASLEDCLNEEGEPDHLMVLEVESGDQVHATNKDEVFLRVGDETRKLNFSQRQELVYDKGQANFERTILPDLTLDVLDPDLLASYRRAVDHDDVRRLLIARGLLAQNGDLTVGALLLFGKNPQAVMPEALVRIVRYHGNERGTGSRQQLVKDVRLEGPIPTLLFEAMDEITGLMPTRRALGSSGKFERIGLIPRDAWLEGLVNAVIHRSYSMQGDHIRVELFDDRIEITSPGRFPGVVEIGDPRAITRFARNPRIARVCSDLRFGQELGEGVRRMCEEMRIAGLADPNYQQTSGSVRLVLSSAPFDRSLDERLPIHARAVMRFLREAGRASTGEIVNAVSLSRPVVLENLHALETEDLIVWIGNSPKDPRAYWKLSIE
jgi:ATP-dependent DNA helicase RecG